MADKTKSKRVGFVRKIRFGLRESMLRSLHDL